MCTNLSRILKQNGVACSPKCMLFAEYSLLAIFDTYPASKCTTQNMYMCVCWFGSHCFTRTTLGSLKEELKKKDEQFTWAPISVYHFSRHGGSKSWLDRQLINIHIYCSWPRPFAIRPMFSRVWTSVSVYETSLYWLVEQPWPQFSSWQRKQSAFVWSQAEIIGPAAAGSAGPAPPPLFRYVCQTR